MNMGTINMYLAHYGLIFVFVIFFLEYLNCPGLIAGIIMPLAGIWAHRYDVNLFLAIGVSVVAGLLASLILYSIGRFGGKYFLCKYINRFPKQGVYINKYMETLRKKGPIGVFITKFVPGIRTLISIPAGILKIDVFKFAISAGAAILIYNAAFMTAGYYLGNAVFTYISLK